MLFPWKVNGVQQLLKKGYIAYGERTYSQSEAKKTVKFLHEKDFLARAISLKGTSMKPDHHPRWVVMYKQRITKRRMK